MVFQIKADAITVESSDTRNPIVLKEMRLINVESLVLGLKIEVQNIEQVGEGHIHGLRIERKSLKEVSIRVKEKGLALVVAAVVLALHHHRILLLQVQILRAQIQIVEKERRKNLGIVIYVVENPIGQRIAQKIEIKSNFKSVFQFIT